VNSRIEVGSATDVGRVRRLNEDFVATAQVGSADGREWALWLVADGVGGGVAGEIASRTAVETVIAFLHVEAWTDPVTALREAFAAADAVVFDITGTGEAATTLVAALVADGPGSGAAGESSAAGSSAAGDDGGRARGSGTAPESSGAGVDADRRMPAAGAEAWIANVGDSRAYLISGGEARQITTDHSLVAARVEAGVISAAEARVAPERNVVTRAIGVDADAAADVFGLPPLLPGERLLLCTDGIHGMIEDRVIARLASGADPAGAAARLVEAANAAGGRDNSTALVGGLVAAASEEVAGPGSGLAPR
jgi:protein phosphatase